MIIESLKYDSSCDHHECQESENFNKAVERFEFPPQQLFCFGDTVQGYCSKHFIKAMSVCNVDYALVERAEVTA